MSGLSVCENIRSKKENDNVKLILFTADDREEIRLKALDAGADHVVVKSPDAGEIVSLVADMLNLP
jgi:DNA-binding response OmpR family regulator